MKRCSQCNQTYADDNLKYCLSDGTDLSPVFEMPKEIPTVERLPNNQFLPQPTSRNINPILIFSVVGFLVLAVSVAGFFWLRTDFMTRSTADKDVLINASNSDETKNSENVSNDEKAALREKQMSLEKEKQKLEDERRKFENQKESSKISSPASPSVSRIKFRRGSISAAVSGNIPNSAARSFVLQARGGQYLSATVDSGDGCIAFDGNSTNVSYTTISGDNFVRLANSCGYDAKFNLTVFIK